VKGTPAPYNITNGWWNYWGWDFEDGVGDSVPPFSFTNGTTGWVCFSNISAQMDTNQPCGYYWAISSSARTYAFVEVGGMGVQFGEGVSWQYDEDWDTVFVCAVPTNSPASNALVVAWPNPGMEEQWLPGCWQISGGQPTNRVSSLVDITRVGTNVVTATAHCSSNSFTLIVVKADIVQTNEYGCVCSTNTFSVTGDSSPDIAWEISPAEPGGAHFLGGNTGASGNGSQFLILAYCGGRRAVCGRMARKLRVEYPVAIYPVR